MSDEGKARLDRALTEIMLPTSSAWHSTEIALYDVPEDDPRRWELVLISKELRYLLDYYLYPRIWAITDDDEYL